MRISIFGFVLVFFLFQICSKVVEGQQEKGRVYLPYHKATAQLTLKIWNKGRVASRLKRHRSRESTSLVVLGVVVAGPGSSRAAREE